MPKSGYIGGLEQDVMATLLRRPHDAYGVTIRRELVERTGTDITLSAIYTTLDRLEKRGFVSSFVGAATPERGGRAKRYFKINAAGVEALAQSWKRHKQTYDGLDLGGDKAYEPAASWDT